MPHRDYAPQLATLVKTPPSGEEWVHEIKYDGYRIGCRIRRGRVTLLTRNGNDWTSAFPEIVEAAGALGVEEALLDGEIAIVDADGRTSFQALQNYVAGSGSPGTLVYFVFDLLRHNGASTTALPLRERKARLHTLLRQRGDRIRFAEHVTGQGGEFFAQACRHGLEGIISKRVSEPYRSGRNTDWVKTKCVLRQEFVIGGFTDPEGARAGLGALLVGYFEGGRLTFAGKVGTGFTHKGALDLRRRLDAVAQQACPFDPPPAGALARRAHWVTPSLVGEVAFTEWTGDGKIRHPSFQGLRADKSARQVTREQPRTGIDANRPRPDAPPAVAGVTITHPERVLYRNPPLTKIDLARYYARIADWIVPHVAGRPLTLVRCPEGIEGKCFFMKHSKVWAPAPLRRVHIEEKTKIGEYLIADDAGALAALVQIGVLEIHTWNSSFDRDVERPNRIVIDIDPGDRVSWAQVVAAARIVRKALDALDLDSFPKTTGGRGLHVVVPLVPRADWSTCLSFARALSEAIERADPQAYTTRFARAGRQDLILLDYLRNNRTNTSIAAYSTRARDGAPVSVPLRWAEVTASLDPQSFTPDTVERRLRRLTRDPWQEYWQPRQSLTAQRLKAVGAST